MLIDFHSHTLPMADHGCDGAIIAEAQLDRAHSAGVDVLCVTPHFYPHRHTVEIFRRKKEVGKALLEGIVPEGLRLVFGAEVLLCEGLDGMEGLEELCFEGTSTMLLELPDRPFNEDLADTVQRIEWRGITVVYAHIERYPAATRRAALSVCSRVQMNYASVAGLFRAGYAKKMAKEGHLVALGGDMHMQGDPYKLLPRVKKVLGSAFGDVQKSAAELLGLYKKSGK